MGVITGAGWLGWWERWMNTGWVGVCGEKKGGRFLDRVFNPLSWQLLLIPERKQPFIMWRFWRFTSTPLCWPGGAGNWSHVNCTLTLVNFHQVGWREVTELKVLFVSAAIHLEPLFSSCFYLCRDDAHFPSLSSHTGAAPSILGICQEPVTAGWWTGNCNASTHNMPLPHCSQPITITIQLEITGRRRFNLSHLCGLYLRAI